LFFSLFSSKNQKLVEQWSKEHKEMVILASDVISAYENEENRYANVHNALEVLKKVSIHHLMDEDIELINMLRDTTKTSREIDKLIVEFRESFKGSKTAVMVFLTDYTYSDAVYDEKFINNFKHLMSVLARRIEFEEKNLYAKLDK